jgi:hypothetical protein
MSLRQRTVKIVQWDGPLPSVGEFIAARTRLGDPWKIRNLQLRRGGFVVLDLYRSGVPPDGAVIHPSARIQPSDPNGPPRVRQVVGSGPTAVMAASWRDPSDIRPNASSRPRQLNGFRRYCPLRRMLEGGSRRITEAHIRAADLFRADVDLARFGASSDLDDAAVVSRHFGPRAGPAESAIAQAEAAAAVQRTFARFPPAHAAMLAAIVLSNRSIRSWCASRAEPVIPDMETGKLISILDVLVDQYIGRITQAHALGEIA